MTSVTSHLFTTSLHLHLNDSTPPLHPTKLLRSLNLRRLSCIQHYSYLLPTHTSHFTTALDNFTSHDFGRIIAFTVFRQSLSSPLICALTLARGDTRHSPFTLPCAFTYYFLIPTALATYSLSRQATNDLLYHHTQQHHNMASVGKSKSTVKKVRFALDGAIVEQAGSGAQESLQKIANKASNSLANKQSTTGIWSISLRNLIP